MGLFDFIKSQFIEVIEWVDNTNDTIVYKFPVAGNEIKMGAKLIVRESQCAVFFNEGKVADVFSAGTHTLSTQNMPVLTKLKSWAHGFNSPFKADVYFVALREFIDLKWGTTNPVMLRDPEFGALRLRAFVNYTMQVTDPGLFITKISGTDSLFTVDEVSEQLKNMIISKFSDFLGEAKIPALDLASQYDEISSGVQAKMQEDFSSYGLQVKKFHVMNISLPEEVEKNLDKRTSMGVIGNLNAFTQFQAANALESAAQNPNSGGLMGMGVGMGAGAGMGAMMANAMQQPGGQNVQQNGTVCSKCSAQMSGEAKFCPSCGAQAVQPGTTPCVKCTKAMPVSAKFCPECGSPQIIKCSGCQKELAAGVKFCPECGTKQ